MGLTTWLARDAAESAAGQAIVLALAVAYSAGSAAHRPRTAPAAGGRRPGARPGEGHPRSVHPSPSGTSGWPGPSAGGGIAPATRSRAGRRTSTPPASGKPRPGPAPAGCPPGHVHRSPMRREEGTVALSDRPIRCSPPGTSNAAIVFMIVRFKLFLAARYREGPPLRRASTTPSASTQQCCRALLATRRARPSRARPTRPARAWTCRAATADPRRQMLLS
jgi:hypothetical protein